MQEKIFTINPIQNTKIMRSKRKTLALQIGKNGELIVRAPLKLSEKYIQDFITKNQAWIQKHQSKKVQTQSKKFIEGEKFWLWGKEYPLKFGAKTKLEFTDKNFEIHPAYKKNAQKIFRDFYKKELAKILPERIKKHAQNMNLYPKEIKISGASRRWGSCNVCGNLNFSWRLAMTPLEILDYVIIHELAHLKELNHSPAFWQIVEKFDPKYKTHKKWLRENEQKFDLFH